MTSRENFNELLVAVKMTDAVIKIQEQKREEVLEKVAEAYRQVVIDEKMLSTITWTESMGGYGSLEPSRQNKDNAADEMVKAMESAQGYSARGYHWSFKLEDGVYFTSNDFKLSIKFENDDMIPDFVKRHNLKIDTSYLDERIKNTKRALATYIKTREQFDAGGNKTPAVPEKEAGS